MLADDVSDCKCIDGYYLEKSEEKCVVCPHGGKCKNNQLTSAPGYWRVSTTTSSSSIKKSSSSSSESTRFFACSPAEACAGNDMCNEDYTGVACGACSEGR